MSRRSEKSEPIEVRESKSGNEFLKISGRLAEKGKSGAALMLFPSQYGGFSALFNMWGNEKSGSGFFPVTEDQLNVDVKNGKVSVTLEFDCGDADYEAAAEFIENPPEAQAPRRSSRRRGREEEEERPRRRSRDEDEEAEEEAPRRRRR